MDLEMSENEYQNAKSLHLNTVTDFRKKKPLQAQSPQQCFRVLYGLVALCVGLLIMTAMITALVPYHKLKEMNQKLVFVY
ncbi:uncharacterized protein LOC134601545 isoform X2 [Pelobates fuscus]|uniref:uncharacterized protein LOC134601545 isoform X2 n=1 Tax=Pelobates fuscus TaxID=191477 RepID=UPI002FE4B1A8